MRQNNLVVVLILAVSIAAVSPAQAQFTKRLKERAKDRVERNIGKKQDEAIDKAMGEGGAAASSAPAAESGTAAAAPEPSAKPAAEEKPGEGVWVNYDFVPGERILYANDFSSDRVGDFPKRLEFVQGNIEVAEWQGQRWLRGTSRGGFDVVLDETLPERFTIEFDAYGIAGSAPYLSLLFAEVSELSRTPKDMIMYRQYDAGVFTGSHSVRASAATKMDKPFRARIMGDGSYIKVYVDEVRVANIPNADIGRSDRIRFAALGSDHTPFMIADIRVAAGGRELYEALNETGRVTTQGILFDTGSATIRPESTPTLEEIARVLSEHPDLRLAIEGHTDSAGDAQSNKTLSGQRAEAVRAFLVASYKIAPERLEAVGHGQEKPVASNDTAEGRQMNRRVELVRL